MQKYILCIEICGTNSRIVMFDTHFEVPKIVQRTDVPTKDISNLNDFINNFLRDCAVNGFTTDTCSISVAGPVENNKCLKSVHVPFIVNDDDIRSHSFLRNILVINDFEAICHGVALLKDDSSRIKPLKTAGLNAGNIAIIGAGTGLGTAFIDFEGKDYFVEPSEAGHSYIDVIDFISLDFFKKLRGRKIVEYEQLLSGNGIVNLFELYKNEADEDTIQEVYGSDDVSKKISELSKTNNFCKKVMLVFSFLYARYAQKIALTYLPKGGVYIAGGIAPKNEQLFYSDFFLKSFTAHPTMNGLLEKIPLFLVSDYDISLYGCVNAARRKF